MSAFIGDESIPIFFNEKFREYGVRYFDGGTSKQEIYFCPWCGIKLPESLRDRWFEVIEEMGYDASDDDIPDHYKSCEWWIR